MNNLKIKGKIVLILSIIIMLVSVFLIVRIAKSDGEGSSPTIYEVDNSFRVDSPLGFNGPYNVNIYGIVENKSDEAINNVVVRVYYYDVDRKRHEVVIPSFNIAANSEYTIDYDTTGQERAFYIDKVEYKVGNGSYKTLSGSTFSSVSQGAGKVLKCIPLIFVLLAGGTGVFIGTAMVTFRKPTVSKFTDVFRPSIRKDMVKCKYCGTFNKNGSSKCSSCGAAIEYNE
jgi:hypothetical protein